MQPLRLWALQGADAARERSPARCTFRFYAAHYRYLFSQTSNGCAKSHECLKNWFRVYGNLANMVQSLHCSYRALLWRFMSSVSEPHFLEVSNKTTSTCDKSGSLICWLYSHLWCYPTSLRHDSASGRGRHSMPLRPMCKDMSGSILVISAL